VGKWTHTIEHVAMPLQFSMHSHSSEYEHEAMLLLGGSQTFTTKRSPLCIRPPVNSS